MNLILGFLNPDLTELKVDWIRKIGRRFSSSSVFKCDDGGTGGVCLSCLEGDPSEIDLSEEISVETVYAKLDS